MKKSLLIKYIAAFLCLLMVLSTPFMSFAQEWQDDDYSVTIFFLYNEEPIRNAHFRLYRIADELDGAENCDLTGDFSDYQVTIKTPLETDGLTALAATLSAFAARDGLVPDLQGDTDERGSLKFKELVTGVYLVDGNYAVEDDDVFYPQPFIVFIPAFVEGEENNRVNANIKYEYNEDGANKPLKRKVVKVWDDGDNPNRPKEVIAQLLMDGEVYDEVALNAENNWRYTWSDLDPQHTWQVIEKDVPADYSVTVTRDKGTFILTNTCDVPEEGWPTEPDTSNPAGTTTPGSGPSTTTPDSDGKKPGSNLPNTGLLWWPVPVLVTSGFALFGVGFVKRKRVDDEEEA